MTPSIDVLRYLNATVLSPALRLLPAAMNTPPARAQLLAIGLQESRFLHRRQINGPARGFWQFERAGVVGTLKHVVSAASARNVCDVVGVAPGEGEVYGAIAYNDILAAAFARLLLRTSPKPLGAREEPEKGWALYIDAWRPGRPHRHTWDAFFDAAWDAVADGRAEP